MSISVGDGLTGSFSHPELGRNPFHSGSFSDFSSKFFDFSGRKAKAPQISSSSRPMEMRNLAIDMLNLFLGYACSTPPNGNSLVSPYFQEHCFILSNFSTNFI